MVGRGNWGGGGIAPISPWHGHLPLGKAFKCSMRIPLEKT